MLLGLHRHNNYLAVGRIHRHFFGGRDAVHIGHVDVHQDDVGLKPLCLFDGLLAVFGRSHNHDVGLEVEKFTEILSSFRDIVNNQNVDLLCWLFCHRAWFCFLRSYCSVWGLTVSMNWSEYGCLAGKATPKRARM